MYVAYTFLYAMGLCVLAPKALWHLISGGRYAVGLARRLGRVPAGLQEHAGAIWIHAVSVGEVHAARGLIPHLRRELRGVPVVLSTTTPTGQEMAGGAGADATFFLPLDLPRALRPYLDALEPRAVLLVETELWPNLLRLSRRRGVPVALVNARLSERSFRRYARLRRLWPAPFRDLSRVLARTPVEAARFRRLGIPASRVFSSGNLKADAAALQPPDQLRRRLADRLAVNGDDELIVAGCTMPDEEQKVLLAFRRLRERHPAARLLLAPRHPQRFDDVETLIRGAGFTSRRRSRAGPDGADVILLDTIGELPAAYGLGQVSFVGGSLVPTGGHNLLEPAIQGMPVVFGPYMENFAAMAAEFESAGAARRVADAEDLAVVLHELLSDESARRRMGDKARAVARADARAGERAVRILLGLLAPAAA